MPGFELVGQEELAAITEIFSKSQGVLFAHGFVGQRNGHYRVREFEKKLAERFNSAHCQAVTSGTAAQFVALKALGIGPGDEVVTQAFTFVATVEAIIECGATPVVVDIDDTLNMDPIALEAAITARTKCIIPVHMLGCPADMSKIMKIAAKHKIPVIEDVCEALGGTYDGKMLGSIGDAGFFSLDFGKIITTGEGGFILAKNPELAELLCQYHDHGHENLPGVPRGLDTAKISGFNFRMTEMQAAVGMAQLAKLDYVLERNRHNKTRLKSQLKDQVGDRIIFRRILPEAGEIHDTLMFFLPNSEQTQKAVSALASTGVGTKNVPDAMNWHFAASWPQVWRRVPRYQDSFHKAWQRSSDLLNRCISLPIMVRSTDDAIDQMAEKIIKAVRSI